MAHFAQIDENNVVTQVVVTDNNDPAGDEGYQFLVDNLGGTWIKTSYNHNIRKRFAAKGMIYDAVKDEFIPQKPFPSWVWSEEEDNWTSPIPRPQDTEIAFPIWDEESQSWKFIKYNGEPLEQ
jgi:hypothetical protein